MNYYDMTETKKKDRQIMAEELRKLAEEFGIKHYIEFKYLGDTRRVKVELTDPVTSLSVMMTLQGDTPQQNSNTFVLSWHFEECNNGWIIDASFTRDINPYHHRKATDVAYGFEHLMHMLRDRLGKIHAGTACIKAPPKEAVSHNNPAHHVI